MDFRRAGVSRQLHERRSGLRPSQRLLPGPELLRSRADVRRASRLRPQLLRSRRRSVLLPGSGRSQLLRSGRPGLLRSGPDLLQHGLQHLLQSPEVQEAAELVCRPERPLRQEESLLRLVQRLLPHRPDLLRSGRSQLLCSRGGPDLCGSGYVVLPLIDG